MAPKDAVDSLNIEIKKGAYKSDFVCTHFGSDGHGTRLDCVIMFDTQPYHRILREVIYGELS